MDARRFQRLAQQHANVNANANNTTPFLAPGLLEFFIPGYGLMERFVSEYFGLDIGLFVSLAVFVVTFVTSARFLWTRLTVIGLNYVMSSVYFDETDELFHHVMDWIAEQRVGKSAYRLKAVSKSKNRPKEDDEPDDDNGLDANELFHYGRWAAKTPPKYEPYFGSYTFFHNYRLFIFERGRKERSANPWDRRTEEEHIFLKTPGWSAVPIKDLLKIIKAWAIDREKSYTVVRCPQAKDVRRYQGAWIRVTSRPSRPMETIVLDPRQKAMLIADVNEYLRPASRSWYATRGIPYRRGYLFHGPPGTGKSSLSFALAGLFGLDIYLVSLLDPFITESDLSLLFNNLPRRCIVLLEDIDSAGLQREDDKDQDNQNGNAEVSTRSKRGGRHSKADSAGIGANDDLKGGISLSGLLNAIDGVASHEGRVLVMTTNYPDRLDSALIRPGRVDMQIAFTLATKHQMREIFIRMYWSDIEQRAVDAAKARAESEPLTVKIESTKGYQESTSTSTSISPSTTPPESLQNGNGSLANGHAHSSDAASNDRRTSSASSSATEDLLLPLLQRTEVEYTYEELKEMADKFAETVPKETFSPAEIQNYLILRRKDPRQAIRELKEWSDEMIRVKESDTQVVSVY